jgi:magnesium transporter
MVATMPSPRSRSETEPPPERVRVVIWRSGGSVEADAFDEAGVRAALADETTRLWIDLTDPTPDLTAQIASVLGLHPLIAEDIAEHQERAKIVDFDDVLHLVLFALAYEGEVHMIELDVVIGRRVLLTVHDARYDPASTPLVRRGVDGLLTRGVDHLLYAIADAIVDGYFPVLDRLGDEIDDLQDDVIGNATPWTLERLFTLKRELVAMRRATSPSREIFNQLSNRALPMISRSQVVYFRDVYDHLLRVSDEIDNYRELVSGTLEVYLSTVNNNLSVIMKRLTGVTVVVAGIGAVAGIFGMSEAGLALSGGEAGGFWLVTSALVVVAVVAVAILRRIDWI